MVQPSNIILIGFMGAGKTSTGRELAKTLGFEFFDTDQWIEARNKKSVPEIFQEQGEPFFRAEEREAVKCIADREKMVISVGGGLWLDEENRRVLARMGWCVWLKVTAQIAWQRVGTHLSNRPLLGKSKDPFAELQKTLAQRDPVYALANAVFDTDEKDPKQVAQEILRSWKDGKTLDPS